MATLKHINSKNADYGAAEQYLLFEHDEFTMKPVLDETGRLIPREDYRLSTLNCGGEDFAVACMRANLRYGKNQRREDVKSHHYIISFDPRDGPDNGLTVDRAQALGEKFCAEHFPGHQALVCTHPDGHNHSGNIHVHIVINSLRIEEVPFLPYMDRPADTKAGCKHRCTDAALRYFKSEVMEMCHREGLYQIDLLNGSKNRVTDREYWAQKKGQAALDKQNAPMIAGGITPRQTKFETNKEKLRQTLRKALATAASFDEFSSLLLQEGVTVKESRGRLSYLTPDRTKPITARKLGDDFDRAAVFAVLEQNAARAAEAPARSPDPPRTIKDRLQVARAEIAAPKQDGVQRLVDIEQKMAEGKGRGYERWAKIHNLKQAAKTLSVYQQYGFTSPEQLEAAVDTAYQKMRQTSGELNAPALEAKNISPEIDLPPHSVYLNSDYSMVERILQNLLTNAIRYSSGDIKMGLKQTRKNRAIFTIKNPIDSKTEINPARLFERFYTGDASRHNSGTGVGLAVVKLLTDKLGGNVSAEIKSNVLTVTLEIQ